MRKRPVRKAISITLLSCFLLIFSVVSFVFGQGQEYLRTRAGGFAATGKPLSGKETASVDYYISVGDVMEVFVWQNPDLSKEVIVGPDGKISYPLVGRIQAVGQTITQLENTITEGLSKYVKYPQVSLMMKQFGGNIIIVLGEVLYPGIYTYTGSINLIQAIALAGYFNDKAREDCILIVRGNFTEHPVVQRINLAKMIRKGAPGTDIFLQPNDVIFVPKSFINDFNKFLATLMPSLTTAWQAIQVGQGAVSPPFGNQRQ